MIGSCYSDLSLDCFFIAWLKLATSSLGLQAHFQFLQSWSATAILAVACIFPNFAEDIENWCSHSLEFVQNSNYTIVRDNTGKNQGCSHSDIQ